MNKYRSMVLGMFLKTAYERNFLPNNALAERYFSKPQKSPKRKSFQDYQYYQLEINEM